MLNPTQPRTTTTLRATVAPPASRRGVSALTSLYLGLQDLAFEALAELLFARGYLVKAAEHDDRESAYERLGFAELERLGAAGLAATTYFQLADEEDHKERFEGHAIAARRIEAGAGYMRTSSTQIEAGRVLVLGARGEGKGA